MMVQLLPHACVHPRVPAGSDRFTEASSMALRLSTSPRCRGTKLLIMKQMSSHVSRGSVGDYHADEQAGVARFRWRISSR